MDEITKKLHEGLKYSQGNLGTTMFIYNEIGLIHSGGNAPDWDQAIAAFRKSLDFREVYYKGDNTFIARGKDNLGRAMALGRQCSDETESLLKEALVTHKKYLGEAHQDVGRNTFNLGLYYLYKAIPDYDKAKKNFLNAKKIYSCLKISESIKLQIKYCDDRLKDVYDGIRNSESNENEFR
ncbi:MAG: tetratricopeptide repeat protein, partial [Eubacteriales bacterium]